MSTSSPSSVQDRVRSRRREEYRRAILDAAEQVFGRAGFGATKMSAIASAAGVATGTLYNYFDSKDEVFAALLQRVQTELLERVSSAASRAKGLAGVEVLVREVFAAVEERGAVYAVMLEAIDLASRGAMDLESEKKAFLIFHGLLRQSIEQAIARRQLRDDIAADVLATSLMGSCHTFVMDWMFRGRAGSVADRADVILELFVAGARPT